MMQSTSCVVEMSLITHQIKWSVWLLRSIGGNEAHCHKKHHCVFLALLRMFGNKRLKRIAVKREWGCPMDCT